MTVITIIVIAIITIILVTDCSFYNTGQLKKYIVNLCNFTGQCNYPLTTDEETRASESLNDLLKFY